jgi:hypothetical protein
MLHEIFEDAVRSRGDLDAVSDPEIADLATAIGQHRPDVVITQAGPLIDGSCIAPMLLANPVLKLVIVAGDRRSATLLHVRGHAILEPSPQEIVDAITAAFRQDGQ